MIRIRELVIRFVCGRAAHRHINRPYPSCTGRRNGKWESVTHRIRRIDSSLVGFFEIDRHGAYPEQSERCVTDFIEEGHILNRGIEEAALPIGCWFFRDRQKPCRQDHPWCWGVGQPNAWSKAIVLCRGERLWNSRVARKEEPLRRVRIDRRLHTWLECLNPVLVS